MKPRWFVILMVLAAFILISQYALADDLADLKAAHMRLVKATNTGDMETLFQFVDDRAVMFGARNGIPHVIRDKEHKAHVKQLYAKFHETHVLIVMWHKPDYRVIGNTGLVWGLVEETMISKNSGISQKYFLKASETYVKSDGNWIWVLGHYTPIPSTQTIY